MALTRKFLTALGIEAEKIDQIIENHSDTVDGLKDEIKGLKEKVATLDDTQKELDKVKSDLAEAQKNLEGKDSYKEKYESLKKEYDGYKSEVATKAEAEEKGKLYRALLKKAGVNEKRIDAIMKVTDLSTLKVNKEKSALEEEDKLSESIKTEWAEFITTQTTKGADTATPPSNNGVNPQAKSRAAEIYKAHQTALYGQKETNQ